jgi:hypothetical protein
MHGIRLLGEILREAIRNALRALKLLGEVVAVLPVRAYRSLERLGGRVEGGVRRFMEKYHHTVCVREDGEWVERRVD